MNFQPPTSGSQNQLQTQQQTIMSYKHIFTQSNPGLCGGRELKYSKILKVKDMLLYFDRTPHLFNDNHEIYNYLLDIIRAFKCQSADALSIANGLIDLLKNYRGLIEIYLASNPIDYKIKGQPDESGYYFEVSIIMNDSTHATALSEDYYTLIVSPPFIANPYIQSAKVSQVPGFSTLQGFTVLELTESTPELMYTNSFVTIAQTQSVNWALRQEFIARNKGNKRQRIN